MEVPEDYVCEHGMPKPWVTCIDCMELPYDEQPQPPREVKPKPAPKAPAKKAARKSASSTSPRAKRPAQPPAGRLPRSVTDPLPDLVGEYDLAYEIPPWDLHHFVSGSDADWLAISSLPTDLRAAGYVYLQVDEELVARARVKGIGFRERRWDPAAGSDLGPGATIEVSGWETTAVDLGPEGAVPVPRFRYLTTGADGAIRVASTD